LSHTYNSKRANDALKVALTAPVDGKIIKLLLSNVETLKPPQFMFIHGCAGSGKSTIAVQLCNMINLGAGKTLKRAFYVCFTGGQDLYMHASQWGELMKTNMNKELGNMYYTQKDEEISGSGLLNVRFTVLGDVKEMMQQTPSGFPKVPSDSTGYQWPVVKDLGKEETLNMNELSNWMKQEMKLSSEEVLIVLDEFPASSKNSSTHFGPARAIRRLLKHCGFKVVIAGTHAKAGNMIGSVSSASTNTQEVPWVRVFPLSTRTGNVVDSHASKQALMDQFPFLKQANPRLVLAVLEHVDGNSPSSVRNLAKAVRRVRGKKGSDKSSDAMEKGCLLLLANNMYSTTATHSSDNSDAKLQHNTTGVPVEYVHEHYAVPLSVRPYDVTLVNKQLRCGGEKWDMRAVYDSEDVLLQWLLIHPSFMKRPVRVVLKEIMSGSLPLLHNAVQPGNDGNELEMLGCAAMCLASINHEGCLLGVTLPVFLQQVSYHLDLQKKKDIGEEGREQDYTVVVKTLNIDLPAPFDTIQVPRYTPPNVAWPDELLNAKGVDIVQFNRMRNRAELDAKAGGMVAEMKDHRVFGATKLLVAWKKLSSNGLPLNIMFLRTLTNLRENSDIMNLFKKHKTHVVVVRYGESNTVNSGVSTNSILIIFVTGEDQEDLR
jgi:hypothetical protein